MNECKPLIVGALCDTDGGGGAGYAVVLSVALSCGRGLNSLTSELNLSTFGNTSLTLELNLSTSGTHPRVNLGVRGTK